MSARELTHVEGTLLRQLAEDLGHEFSGALVSDERPWTPVESWWARVINNYPYPSPSREVHRLVRLPGGFRGPRYAVGTPTLKRASTQRWQLVDGLQVYVDKELGLYRGRPAPCAVVLAREVLVLSGRSTELLDATCTVILTEGRAKRAVDDAVGIDTSQAEIDPDRRWRDQRRGSGI